MKFTKSLIDKTWEIRRAAAAKFNCPVKEIMWGLCMEMAKEELMNNDMAIKLNDKISYHSGSGNVGMMEIPECKETDFINRAADYAGKTAAEIISDLNNGRECRFGSDWNNTIVIVIKKKKIDPEFFYQKNSLHDTGYDSYE